MLMDASGSAAKIVFGHYPVFVKSFGEDRSTNNFLPSERDRYWKLFKRYGVTAYGCGHTHYPYNSTYLAIDAATCGALAAPLGQGFRGAMLWKVSETGKVTHEFIAYKDFEKIESL